MGQENLVLKLTNRAATACELRGWPAVVAQSASARLTAAHIRAEPALDTPDQQVHGLPAVRIVPGAAAYVIVHGFDFAESANGGSAEPCPAPFDRLVLRLPRSTHALEIGTTRTYRGGMPSCGGAFITPLLPAADVIPKRR